MDTFLHSMIVNIYIISLNFYTWILDHKFKNLRKVNATIWVVHWLLTNQSFQNEFETITISFNKDSTYNIICTGQIDPEKKNKVHALDGRDSIITLTIWSTSQTYINRVGSKGFICNFWPKFSQTEITTFTA